MSDKTLLITTASAVIAMSAASAMASGPIDANISTKHSTEYSGHVEAIDLTFGLGNDAYLFTEVDTEGYFELGVGRTFALNEQGTYVDVYGAYTDSDYRAAVKVGQSFDNGLFVSGRYRYQYGNDSGYKWITGEDGRSKIHRTDLTVGTSLQMATLSYNWIYQNQQGNGVFMNNRNNWNEHEFTAHFEGFNQIRPFVQYAYVDKNILGERDNTVKVGLNYRF